ncbi:MAG: DUF5996 family protein, partial [Gemmatimonadota bacterium]
YVTPRGLTTSSIPHGGRAFELEFDFVDHRLRIETSDGRESGLALEPRSVADFYRALMGRLDDLGLHVAIWPRPVEVEEAIPFEEDEEHASYDPAYADRLRRALIQTDRVLHAFCTGFVGKTSPVHFFWGAFDLAVTRFSGRGAPEHPGGFPNVGRHVMVEAYSHELASFGWWPGGGVVAEPAFYAYAYPEPGGFRDADVGPDAAHYLTEMGEFILPYEAVRRAPDPDAAVLRFCKDVYAAAAGLGSWDREALERRDEASKP